MARTRATIPIDTARRMVRSSVSGREMDGKSGKERGGDELGTGKAEIFGDNGQNQHGDCHCNTGGNGKLEDVFDEFVFDAGGVGLESEDDAGETDAGEVQDTHLEGSIGVFKRNQNKEDGENSGIGVFAEEEGSRAL